MLSSDLVAEEVRRLADGVGDQGLGFGQLQLEFLAQERPDLLLDLFGLVLGTGEPEQEVVALCRRSGYADARADDLVGGGSGAGRSA